MQDLLTVDDFALHVGRAFLIEDLADVTLELVGVEPLSLQPSASRQAFSLWFRGPAVPTLPQRTYRFAHPTRGPLDVFIVPLGPEGGGMRYEAIFN
jgi:hypothetical protein